MRDNQQHRFGFRRTQLLQWLGLVWIAALAGCNGDSTPTVDIGKVLDSQWNARYAGYPGGLTAVMITPTGEYFASTIAGTTPSTHFRGASTTKMFTAAAIMLLDQRGQLRIDDVVTDSMPGGSGKPYLPTTPGYDVPYKSQITIRQLLQHRSGVFDVANEEIPTKGVTAPYAGKRYIPWVMESDGDHTFTLDELVGVMASNRLFMDPPGIVFRYNDAGYWLLAKIVEQVSGKPFVQFIRDEFVVPNGLADTTFPILGTTQTLPAPFIDGYLRQFGKVGNVTQQNVSAGNGDGNVVTTPADLSRWTRRLLRGEAGVESKQVTRMRECVPTGNFFVAYGLGLECHPAAFGWGHNGGNPGYLTVARHDIDTDVTVMLFSTLGDYDDIPGVTAWLYDTLTKVRATAGY